jgi:hypothetical protein
MKIISNPICAALLAVIVLGASQAFAGCEKTVGKAKSEFTGDSLKGLVVDKKALPIINKKFPNLHVTEEVLSGNLITCNGSDCVDNFVTCTE